MSDPSVTNNPDPASPKPAPAPTPAQEETREARERSSNVLIRPWPKVVFFYPTFVISTVFFFVSVLSKDGATGVSGLGGFWFIVFSINLLVFAFDFSRIKSITLLLLIVALVLAGAWANTEFAVLDSLKGWMDQIDIRMNTQFYGFFSALFAVIFLCVLINTRFNYYEINHREILHHHGYLGDVTRMPTTGLRVHKEIYDLMEFALLRSGRLVFYPSTSREAIVIDNVINVNSAEDRIKDILSVVAVRMQHDL